ncbi:MAG: hypothetical protein R3326_05695 [Gemmatimonadota bacterium]|nr:hypothetical protein [Gemmatimonadota bacterium]
MAEIRIEHAEGDVWRVEVAEGGSSTEHRVTVTDAHRERFGGGADTERLLEESFEFLLEREPKESILSTFELPVIARYFPGYPEEIRRRVG